MYFRVVYTPQVPNVVEKFGTDGSLENFLSFLGARCARGVLAGKQNLNGNLC